MLMMGVVISVMTSLMMMVVLMMLSMIVMGVIGTMTMLVVVMGVVAWLGFAFLLGLAEAVGVGIHGLQGALTAGIGQQPVTALKQAQGIGQQLALIIIARGMLEADQVDTGNFQLQSQSGVFEHQVALGCTMDMGIMLALDLGGQRCGQ